MIKASEGGGGKGIRKAANIEDFPIQFRQVTSFKLIILANLFCLVKSFIIGHKDYPFHFLFFKFILFRYKIYYLK